LAADEVGEGGQGKGEDTDGESAQASSGAMSRAATQDLAVGPNRCGYPTRAEPHRQDVGAGEGQQQTPQTERWIDFQTQAAHPQVGLPVPESQLDGHPLAVEGHDFSGGQLRRRARGDQEEPRLLKAGVVEDTIATGSGTVS